MPPLIFHGFIGNFDKFNQKAYAQFHAAIDIPHDLHTLMLVDKSIRLPPTTEQLMVLDARIQEVIPDVVDKFLSTQLEKNCCICKNVARVYRPYCLGLDITMSWDWLSDNCLDPLGDHRIDLNEPWVHPQVWCRIYPSCGRSEGCYTGIMELARGWDLNDNWECAANISESYGFGLEALDRGKLSEAVLTKPTLMKPGSYCHGCGSWDPGMRCSGCNTSTTYCSRDCQRKDWKHHKELCRASRIDDRVSQDATQRFTLEEKTASTTSCTTDRPGSSSLPIDVPKRQIFYNGSVYGVVKSLPKVVPYDCKYLLHGIVGNPFLMASSELFRFIFQVPHDLGGLSPSLGTSETDRQSLAWLLSMSAISYFTDRAIWRCVGCDEPTCKFYHDTTFTYHDPSVASTSLSNTWCYSIPYCPQNDGCLNVAKKLVVDFKAEPRAMEEYRMSLKEGSKREWHRVNLIKKAEEIPPAF
ncbi:hypothetical protein BJ508DRAFT_325752 [Ascobolus immersus RN42]|uniref:MYND-type domain-containing protein n=1 Tax=Ascobolus immersus RN42 TaxID=1160509 RepID=A0A3N4I814_ASCIM|nr:hypothetical protein BJ508DRAFT_325752 [Ascobolus immersus RN42]